MEEEQRKLTIKQRKWLKLYIETGNATQAAMQSYDCKDEGSAANIGYENVKKLDIGQLLEENGISDQELMKTIAEGLKAVRQLSARIIIKKNSPTSMANEELAEANQRTDDFIEVDDFLVRHKYLETALKLKGRLNNNIDITSKGDKLESPVLYIPAEKD